MMCLLLFPQVLTTYHGNGFCHFFGAHLEERTKFTKLVHVGSRSASGKVSSHLSQGKQHTPTFAKPPLGQKPARTNCLRNRP